jgi:hypothetical protein
MNVTHRHTHVSSTNKDQSITYNEITVSIPANNVSTVIPITSLKSVSFERKYSLNNDDLEPNALILVNFSLTILKAILNNNKKKSFEGLREKLY